eukprot:TRINITY_DN11793_c0_g1_i1.p1 TRINITY_DN11793_c0_g1~~TRINITY_DN11793_c0_g1_i1.p1  ORF type:complete len:306 (+),score=49.32 TRINITY_DN11793_c0_g1_i1:158-1075(+)
MESAVHWNRCRRIGMNAHVICVIPKKKIGSVEFYNQVESKKYFVEPHIREFADFGHWQHKNVLEIGGGLGTEAINFARAGATHLVVLELSSESLELMRTRFEVLLAKEFANMSNTNRIVYKSTDGQVVLIHGDGETLSKSLKDAGESETSFDLVWSFGVLHHTPQPERIVQEIAKVLKPDGETRLMVYSKVSFKLFWIMNVTQRWDFQDDKMDDLLQFFSEAQSGSPVTWSYTLKEARELMTKNGFTVTDIGKRHIFPWKIDMYRQGFYEKEDWWKGISNARLRDLEEELGWHTLITAILDRSSE